MSTFGPTYEYKIDEARVMKQMDRIRLALSDHTWTSLAELADRTGDPEASISAQVRHLRKPRFGGHTIDKRRRHELGGTWEYRMVPDGGEHV